MLSLIGVVLVMVCIYIHGTVTKTAVSVLALCHTYRSMTKTVPLCKNVVTPWSFAGGTSLIEL